MSFKDSARIQYTFDKFSAKGMTQMQKLRIAYKEIESAR